MQDQLMPLNQQDPDMVKDRTKDEGMPLRNHEQVLLLNEDNDNIPPNLLFSNIPNTQALTQVTHNTQNSGLMLGILAGVNTNQGHILSSSKSPPADIPRELVWEVRKVNYFLKRCKISILEI